MQRGCFFYSSGPWVGKTWVKPCPAAEVCSMLAGLDRRVFCVSSKNKDAEK
jgi:hypothetical protein